MPLTPVQKLSVTVGAALVVLVGFGAASYYYTARLVASDGAVERTNIHMSAALTLVAARQDGERLTKAYVVRPDSLTRTALEVALARAEDALEVLTRGTEDNPRQSIAIQALASGVAESFGTFRTTLLLRDRAGADSARRQLSGDVSASTADSLMKMVTAIHDEELRILAEQTRLQSSHGASAQRAILLTMVLTLLLAGVALQPMRPNVATRITAHIVREHATGEGVLSDDAGAERRPASPAD
jgi:CHASE3 domain sensor protein